MRLILASASPARLATLQRAGIRPEVIVSGVDESGVSAAGGAALAGELAELKCQAVHSRVGDDDAVVLGCDSVLSVNGQVYGKPVDPAEAASRWHQMSGRSGVLHTGHSVRQGAAHICRTASTVVHFAELSDAEIDSYVATGEPLHVAGAFTVDGYGGAFITGIEGDHHNVVGISLPLLRTMLAELGIGWSHLWH